VFQGAAWQRCRVHFMRNVLSAVPKGSQDMVASIIRTAVAQPDAGHVNTQFDEVTRMLAKSHPKVAAMLTDARDDVLAFAGFPARHWRQIWSTNPMERVNKEIKRGPTSSGSSPTRLPSSGSPAQSSSSNTTNGKPGTAATFRGLHSRTQGHEHDPRPPLREAILLPELTAA
jgi:putative transposase